MEQRAKYRFWKNWHQRVDAQSRKVCCMSHIQTKETIVKLHAYYGLNYVLVCLIGSRCMKNQK